MNSEKLEKMTNGLYIEIEYRPRMITKVIRCRVSEV